MPKVTFVAGEYPPMQGGIADHTAYLAAHLRPIDITPSVLIASRWQNTPGDPPTLPIDCVPDWGWRSWPAVTRYLRTHAPDLLHIQYQAAAFELKGWINWLPWYLKRRGYRTPVVTTFHDLRVPYLFPKAGPLRWQAILALGQHSDAIICTNREDLFTLRETLNLEQYPTAFDPTAITYPHLAMIPLGSNVEPQPPPAFDRSAWRHRYSLEPDALLLAYFGFLNESKGGEELITAVGHLRTQGVRAHLLLIGGDIGHADPTNRAYAARVQRLIDRHNLMPYVHRTGYTNPAEVSANLLAADAIVMPYRDGVSFRRTTLIAALRHGCPVVSTTPSRDDIVPEIIPGENMLLAPPHDASGLAQTIAPLATDATLRQTLATGAKTLGNLFEWDTIAHETATLYQRLL